MTLAMLRDAMSVERAFFSESASSGGASRLLDLTGEDGVIALVVGVTLMNFDADLDSNVANGMVLHTDRSLGGGSIGSLSGMFNALGGGNPDIAGQRESMGRNRVIAVQGIRLDENAELTAGSAMGVGQVERDLTARPFPVARFCVLSYFKTAGSRQVGCLIEFHRLRVDVVTWAQVRRRFMTEGNAGDALRTRKVDVPGVPG